MNPLYGTSPSSAKYIRPPTPVAETPTVPPPSDEKLRRLQPMGPATTWKVSGYALRNGANGVVVPTRTDVAPPAPPPAPPPAFWRRKPERPNNPPPAPVYLRKVEEEAGGGVAQYILPLVCGNLAYFGTLAVAETAPSRRAAKTAATQAAAATMAAAAAAASTAARRRRRRWRRRWRRSPRWARRARRRRRRRARRRRARRRARRRRGRWRCRSCRCRWSRGPSAQSEEDGVGRRPRGAHDAVVRRAQGGGAARRRRARARGGVARGGAGGGGAPRALARAADGRRRARRRFEDAAEARLQGDVLRPLMMARASIATPRSIWGSR